MTLKRILLKAKLFFRKKQKKFNFSNITNYYSSERQKFERRDNLATVIIPIYNGYEHVVKMFESLNKYTSDETKVIVLNDCSSDCRIKLLLNKYCIGHNYTVINNENNLGFVQTINKGMSYVSTPFAVWLNSDTIVVKNWINKLLNPFFIHKNVASTTPFTNSGTLFSFPNFLENNNLVDSLENINSGFEHIKDFDSNRNFTTTGVGFCMAINMDAWNDVGELDYKSFGKGYGEENDWCYRALKKKWKHMLAVNLFIAHIHGGSFSKEQKDKNCEDHLKILEKKHPHYFLLETPKMFRDNSWLVYRQICLLYLSKINNYGVVVSNGCIIFSSALDPKEKNKIFLKDDFDAEKIIKMFNF